MKKRWLLLLAIWAFMFAIEGCDNSRNRIVGRWKFSTESNSMVWEFFKDGTLLADSSRGKYTFGDGQRVKIQTPSATFVYRVEFLDDRMIWQDPNGAKIELKRIE